jgi:hypothetical protein
MINSFSKESIFLPSDSPMAIGNRMVYHIEIFLYWHSERYYMINQHIVFYIMSAIFRYKRIKRELFTSILYRKLNGKIP